MTPASITAAAQPKSVIVTGAASGIGEAVARRLASEGWIVVGVDQSADALQALADDLAARGAVLWPIVGDVADRSVHRAACDAASAIAPLGAWVGVAGVTHTYELTEMTEEQARRIVDINQFGLLWGSTEALRTWTNAGSPGVIVVISSVHARHAAPDHTVYEMTKAAADALVRNIAVSYGPQRIRAVGIAPGAIATPALLASLDSAPDPAAAQRHLEALTPAERIGEPDEIAAVVSFLVSDEASYVSGTTLTVDGGWSAVLVRRPGDPAAVRPTATK